MNRIIANQRNSIAGRLPYAGDVALSRKQKSPALEWLTQCQSWYWQCSTSKRHMPGIFEVSLVRYSARSKATSAVRSNRSKTSFRSRCSTLPDDDVAAGRAQSSRASLRIRFRAFATR